MGGRPLLELSTLSPERPNIVIDGTAYELAVPSDFGLREQARLLRLQRAVEPLQGADDPSDEEVEAAAQALEEITRLLVRGAPAEVLARLTDGQRIQIAQAFTEAASPKTDAAPPDQIQTGETSSLASSVSTAVRRRTG